MLKEIYNLGLTKEDIDKKYFERGIKGYIKLTSAGDIVSEDDCFEKCKNKIIVPKFQNRKTCSNTANILVEQNKFIFDDSSKKYPSFKHHFEELKGNSKELNAIYIFLYEKYPKNKTYYNNLFSKYFNINTKGDDFISFKVDDVYIEEDKDSWVSYFENTYSEYEADLTNTNKETMVSCVSNTNIVPLDISPQVKSFLNGKGDYIFCFDKSSFSSYGLEKGMNCPMSEEEALTIVKGLEIILDKNHYSKRFNIGHWYSEDIPLNEDVINIASGDFDFLSFNELNNEINKDEYDKKLNEFIEDFCTKDFKNINSSDTINDIEFYFINCVSCNGRFSFSNYKKGKIGDIYKNVQSFYNDSLIDIYGEKRRLCSYFKLFVNLTYSDVSNSSKKFEIIDSELGRYKNDLFLAVIYNKQFPKELFIRAIFNIRRNINNKTNLNVTLLQFIKLYLIRDEISKKGDSNLMPNLNEKFDNPAYLCGRIFRLYEKIQETAIGKNLNTSIRDKYFNSCSKNPSKIIPIIANLGMHHLSKIDKGLANFYQRKLDNIYCLIGENSLPNKMTIEEQGYFILGYYQEADELFSKNDKNECKNIEE